MQNLSRILFLLLALGLFVPSWSYAEKNIVSKKYNANTSVSVDHLFDSRVKSGFHPYKVTIRNGELRPITWTFRFNTDSSPYRYQSTHQIRVEPRSEAVEELLVPAPPTKGHRYSSYRNVRLNVTSPGLASVPNRSISGSIDDKWPSIGISKKLASRNLTRLATLREEKKRGQNYFASQFNELPSTWKGLTCLDILMIDEAAWRALPKEQKRAVMTWVRFGGRLELYTEKKDAIHEELGFEKPDSRNKQSGTYTLGTIKINVWDGTNLPDGLVNRYAKSRQFDSSFNHDFDKSWGMISKFGTKNFNPYLVFFLLAVFAVLVGPVNLFHFAKEGQRHRLFITTPIISAIASLVMIVVILVQDGMGGSGRRIAFIDVQSNDDQRQLQIIQHQISRTGVMLQSGFENEAIPGLTPVKLPSSRWNPTTANHTRTSSYQFRKGNFSGDVFRSRAEQGYHLRSVRASRSRIELKKAAEGGAPPQLFSSLEFALKQFHYIDSDGVVWKSRPDATINSGEEIQLQESSLTELQAWLNETCSTVARADQIRINQLKSSRQRYFGIAASPSPLLIKTHSAIRWKEDVAIVSGITVEP